jgi:hypothetical protein
MFRIVIITSGTVKVTLIFSRPAPTIASILIRLKTSFENVLTENLDILKADAHNIQWKRFVVRCLYK